MNGAARAVLLVVIGAASVTGVEAQFTTLESSLKAWQTLTCGPGSSLPWPDCLSSRMRLWIGIDSDHVALPGVLPGAPAPSADRTGWEPVDEHRVDEPGRFPSAAPRIRLPPWGLQVREPADPAVRH